MAPTPSLSPATTDVLGRIEQLFQLSNGKLIDITRQFVEDYNLGLGEYNKAMAMMCVPTTIRCVSLTGRPTDLRSSLVSPMGLRRGKEPQRFANERVADSDIEPSWR